MLNKYQILHEAKTKKLLIDTGPLSLILIGSYKLEKLNKFRAGSKKFDEDDFKILVQFLQDLDLFITPQILAETNNIVKNSIGKEELEKLMKNNMIFLKDRLAEIYIKKNRILENDLVLKFGITDISIFLSSKNKIVLTIDWALRNICRKNKISAYHLDEITSIKWVID